MHPDDCLAKVAAVRAATSDPEGAYLIRTRLRRAVLACHRAVAYECGVPAPSSVEYLSVTSGDARALRIAAAANRVLGLSERLCQPSESLDVRWKQGWSRLDSALSDLESVLKAAAS